MAKWYLSETSSGQVAVYIVGLDIGIINTLVKNQTRCLLARRKRMQEISPELRVQIYATFLEDITQGHSTLYQLDSATHLLGMLAGYNLRTLDAIHLTIAQHDRSYRHNR